MAKLEIGLTAEEETRLLLLGPTPVTFTTDDREVYEIPDLAADLERATALASEETLRRLWDTPEEDAAW